MKATLKFNLKDPEEREEHLRCVKSLDMASVLFEFTANSKKRIESNIEKNETSRDPLDFVYLEFNRLLEKHNINIEELIT